MEMGFCHSAAFNCKGFKGRSLVVVLASVRGVSADARAPTIGGLRLPERMMYCRTGKGLGWGDGNNSSTEGLQGVIVCFVRSCTVVCLFVSS